MHKVKSAERIVYTIRTFIYGGGGDDDDGKVIFFSV
jgi:hypothetical protein